MIGRAQGVSDEVSGKKAKGRKEMRIQRLMSLMALFATTERTKSPFVPPNYRGLDVLSQEGTVLAKFEGRYFLTPLDEPLRRWLTGTVSGLRCRIFANLQLDRPNIFPFLTSTRCPELGISSCS